MSRYQEPWGICQRSGLRVPLSRLVNDGQVPALRVDPRWRDEKHPQETPTPVREELAVMHAAPERDNPIDFQDGFVVVREGELIGDTLLLINDEVEDQQQLLEVDRQ